MSSSEKLTRQQLYDKIRESSKEEYILKEMQRLGYWPENSDSPSLSEELISRKAELETQLNQLSREKRLLDDQEQALKALHKERKKQALERREKTKQARNEARLQRALRWQNIQKERITFLGENHSVGLANIHSNTELLKQQQLPMLESSAELADAMGISIQELRFLTYAKDVSKISHYQRFDIKKKTGGVRTISAPMPRLKRAQYWVLVNMLEPLTLHDAAHGFVRERSIVSNAQAHVGQDVVINVDLQNFFPTISYPRVKGLFQNLGYSEHLATILGLLCTEPDSQQVQLDGELWHVGSGERYLPQGAPTSPNISNLICRKLDRRLSLLAEKRGFNYSRYADDISFSANAKSDKDITRLLWALRTIVRDEGFHIHPQKTQIMRKHQQQEVTGIVVNDKPGLDRKTLKRFRALLFQIDKDGPQDKVWRSRDGRESSGTSLFSAIEGYANFVAMVDAAKGIPLQKQVMELKLKYGISVKSGKIQALNRKLFKLKAANGEAPRDTWWMAQAPELPKLELTAEQIAEIKKANKAAADQQQRQMQSAMHAGLSASSSAQASSRQDSSSVAETSVDSAQSEQNSADRPEPGRRGDQGTNWLSRLLRRRR